MRGVFGKAGGEVERIKLAKYFISFVRVWSRDARFRLKFGIECVEYYLNRALESRRAAGGTAPGGVGASSKPPRESSKPPRELNDPIVSSQIK